MNFREAFYDLLPRWLTEGEGEKVLYSLAAVKDAFAQRAREGLLARFPEYGPADALEFHGRDRKIIRGVTESRESYEKRLLRWLDDHATRGGPYAFLDQVGAFWDNAFPANGPRRIALIYRNGLIFERDPITKEITWSNITWDVDSTPEIWGRVWLIIHWPDGSVGSDNTWDFGGTWDDGGVWDSNATPEMIERLRRVPRAWNAAHIERIRIILIGEPAGEELWDYPVGTWDEPGGVWGESDPAIMTVDVEQG